MTFTTGEGAGFVKGDTISFSKPLPFWVRLLNRFLVWRKYEPVQPQKQFFTVGAVSSSSFTVEQPEYQEVEVRSYSYRLHLHSTLKHDLLVEEHSDGHVFVYEEIEPMGEDGGKRKSAKLKPFKFCEGVRFLALAECVWFLRTLGTLVLVSSEVDVPENLR